MTGTTHTPRYLLRRRSILSMVRRLPPGRFLDIGCGRGELLPWLSKLGFDGLGFEISDTVRPIAERAIAEYPDLRIVGREEDIGDQTFPYVMAFEVLEHVENDLELLTSWVRWLDDDGVFLISVPARQKYWSAADEAVGHFRRYEKSTLLDLVEASGLRVVTFWSYGFPLILLTKPIRDLVNRRSRGTQTKQERTLESAMDSTIGVSRGGFLVRLVVGLVASLAHWLGLPFRASDLGDGYLVACVRAEAPPL